MTVFCFPEDTREKRTPIPLAGIIVVVNVCLAVDGKVNAESLEGGAGFDGIIHAIVVNASRVDA